MHWQDRQEGITLRVGFLIFLREGLTILNEARSCFFPALALFQHRPGCKPFLWFQVPGEGTRHCCCYKSQSVKWPNITVPTGGCVTGFHPFASKDLGLPLFGCLEYYPPPFLIIYNSNHRHHVFLTCRVLGHGSIVQFSLNSHGP